MCGIAGIICTDGAIDHGWLRAMSSSLRHRGPDGFGYLTYSRPTGVRIWHNEELTDDETGGVVGFVHTRLSIIDLSVDGLQPMSDEEGDLCVVYNGEIYNYLELRRELETLGYRFRTRSDTEVLLKSYRAWGPACIKRFNGMWAFVMLDLPSQRVLISRDRFGIKPLYYSFHGGRFFFASEIKGLLALNAIPCAPNEKAVADFLLGGLVDNKNETFFGGVFQFPAAHIAEISLNDSSLNIRRERYWTFPIDRFKGSFLEAAGEFRELFLDAIRVHSRSDVAIGTCLSGGIDSSSIVCSSELLRRKSEIPSYSHNAFGYCSSDEKYSERRFMEAVVEATRVRMHFVEVGLPDFTASLPAIIQAQDEPFGSASIAAQWFVFDRARREGMTVMLDGQGADEILGGYHHYFDPLAGDMARRKEIFRLLALKNAYEREIGPFPVSFQSLAIRLLPEPLERLVRAAKKVAMGGVTHSPMHRVIRSELAKQSEGILRSAKKSSLSFNETLERDVQHTSLPALLRYEDRNSMAHSIEARVPFLDHRLVEFVFMLPDEWKICNTTTKYILRECMKNNVPESVIGRKDKIGFKASPGLTFEFTRQNLKFLARNMSGVEERWFKPGEIEEMLKGSNQTIEEEFLIWRIINTKLWARKFWS